MKENEGNAPTCFTIRQKEPALDKLTEELHSHSTQNIHPRFNHVAQRVRETLSLPCAL